MVLCLEEACLVPGVVVGESWPGVSMVLWLRRAGLVCQWFCGLGELAWCVNGFVVEES